MVNLCKYSKALKKHFIDNAGQGNLKQDLLDTGADAQLVDDIVRTTRERFKRTTATEIDKIMNSLTKKYEVKPKSKAFRQLIEDSVAGNLNATLVSTRVAQELNIPTLNKQKAQRIVNLTNDIQKMKKEGVPTNKLREKVAYLEREIAEATPASFSEKAETYTIANLLLNPKTIQRNIYSNEIELLGKQIESVVRGRWKATDAKLLANVRKESWNQVVNDIEKGIRTTQLTGSELYGGGIKRSFRPEDAKGLAKVVENFGAFQEKGLRYALEAHDVMVRRMSFAQSIMTQLRGIDALKGVEFDNSKEFETFLRKLDEGKVQGVAKERWEEIKFTAEWEAAHTVLQDSNAVTEIAKKFFGRLPDSNPLALPLNFILGTAAKFVRTPTNVAVRMIEKDLIGGSAITAARVLRAKKQGLSKEALVELAAGGMARALTNSLGMGGAGFVLSSMGFIQPEGYKNSQVLKVGDLTINIAPFALFMPQLTWGAEIDQAMEKYKDENIGIVKSVLESYGKNTKNLGAALLDMPMVTGIKQLAGVIEGGKTRNLEGGIEELLQMGVSGAQQWLPFITLIGNTAKALDDKERETYDKNQFKRALNYTISKIPGLRQQLAIKQDTAGREVQTTFKNPAARALNAIFNPALVRRSTQGDPVWKELKALSKEQVRKRDKFDYAPNSFRRKKVKYELSNDEKRQFQKDFGNYAYPKIERLIKTSQYKNADPDTKQELIHKIELDGRRKAKEIYLAKRGN